MITIINLCVHAKVRFIRIFTFYIQQKDNVVEFPEKGHRVRHASSTFYIGRSVPEEASYVSEGWLYKRGKIVRNWKQRWFILDTEKGDVSDH